MQMGRDAVLEGARPLDVAQLQLLAAGDSLTATAEQLAQIEAKGWLQTVGGVHLITIAGRTLLELPAPAKAS